MNKRPSPLLAGVAAVIVAAVGWNVATRWQPQHATPETMVDELQEPLERLASGVPRVIGSDAIIAIASFVTAQGQYCREYEISASGHKSHGVACRDAKARWTPGTAAGRRLSADEERAAIGNGWRRP